MGLVDGTCDRCGEKTGVTKMSFFNRDIICLNCVRKEEEHPKYPEAKRIEENHVVKANNLVAPLRRRHAWLRATNPLSPEIASLNSEINAIYSECYNFPGIGKPDDL